MIPARVLFRRVAAMRGATARCLATSGTKPVDVVLGPDAELPKSGYYSPQSIDRRVAMGSRPRGESGVGRTTPPLSEEDHWHLAGAPGYEGQADSSKQHGGASVTNAVTSSASAAAPVHSHSGSIPSSPLASDNDNAEFPLFSKDPTTFPYVRISHTTVQASKLPAFLRTYQLSVTPAYLSSPGLSSLQLLIGDVPVDAAPADIALACFNHGNANNTVPVVSITTWANEGVWRRGVERGEYRAAMQTIAPYFSHETSSHTHSNGNKGAGAAAVHTIEYRAVVNVRGKGEGTRDTNKERDDTTGVSGDADQGESAVGSELGLR